MDISNFALMFASLSIVFAALIHAVLGFGFPMVATPLLALESNVQTAILFSLFPTICVNLITMFYRRDGGASIFSFAPLALYGVLGTLLGTQVLLSFSPEPFRLFLALIIFVYLYKEKLAMHKIAWIKEHQNISMLFFGLLAGFVSGTTNIMIPILLIYLSEIDVERNLMIRVMNLCFFSAKLTQVGQFAVVGLLDNNTLYISAVLSLAAILALFLGFKLQAKISDAIYHKLLRILLMIMAYSLIFQFFRGLTL